MIARYPKTTVVLTSSTGPLLLGMATALMGLGLAPGILGGAIGLYIFAMGWGDSLVDWIDGWMREPQLADDEKVSGGEIKREEIYQKAGNVWGDVPVGQESNPRPDIASQRVA